MLITFVLVILTYIGIVITEPIILRSLLEVEHDYLNKFKPSVAMKNKIDSICDLPKAKKLALCQTIFAQGNYKNNLGLHLNKSASHELEPQCEEKIVHFFVNQIYNYKKIKHLMFPCYGRHEPMRTSWKMDNKLNLIYLSDTFENNSVYVYMHHWTANSDTYTLFEKVINIDYKWLVPRVINDFEVDTELQSLEILAINSFESEIEINYLREAVVNGIVVQDHVCDLETKDKLKLCKFLLNNDSYIVNNNISIDEEAFLYLSTECVTKFLGLKYDPDYKNMVMHNQKMFPCYAKPTKPVPNVQGFSGETTIQTAICLSGGYRSNSVTVYMKHYTEKYSDYYVFYEFAENLKIEYL